MTHIAKNLENVRASIAKAEQKAGLEQDSVTLVAVSKLHSVESIQAAYDAGQRHFGENYAQELRDKADALRNLKDIHWHFIGHLQTNKAKYIAPCAQVVETIDSFSLIEELSRQCEKTGRAMDCLVQVNVGGEEQKSGCEPGKVKELLDSLDAAPHLKAAGLMTIPPWDLEVEQTRKYFKALYELREKHGGQSRLPMLSMGMSHDFETAIEEGATIVRVGTAIFGERN